MLAVVVITEAVGSNVSFLRFYTENRRSGYDNISVVCSIGLPAKSCQSFRFQLRPVSGLVAYSDEWILNAVSLRQNPRQRQSQLGC